MTAIHFRIRPAGPLSAAVLPLVVSLVGGCRREPSADSAAIRQRLEIKGTAQVMAEVARADFRPPAAGELTARQIEMYVAVRRRERQIREAARQRFEPKTAAGLGGPARRAMADLATADLRAAQELGDNPKEYAWVKDRVLEAQIAATSEALARQLESGRVHYLALLKQRKSAAADAVGKAAVDRQIADFRKSAAESTPRPAPAVRHNAELLARYEEQLAAVQAPGKGNPNGK